LLNLATSPIIRLKQALGENESDAAQRFPLGFDMARRPRPRHHPVAAKHDSVIDPAEVSPILPGIDLWDLWPLQNADGTTTLFDGTSLWFILCAPALPDPEARHDIVRIRLMTRTPDGAWHDHGHALPDGFNPGSREWAGSALWHPETGEVTLFYTVAGYPGEEARSFAQRLFQTKGKLDAQISPLPDGAPLAKTSSPITSITCWSISVKVCPVSSRDFATRPISATPRMARPISSLPDR
jgi:hypothetical protein